MTTKLNIPEAVKRAQREIEDNSFDSGAQRLPKDVLALAALVERLYGQLESWPENHCDPSNDCYDDCATSWIEGRDIVMAEARAALKGKP